jgi:hypothetical protein
MARNPKDEAVYRSFEELRRALLPSEVGSDLTPSADSAALGETIAAESLSLMARALAPASSRRVGRKSRKAS